MLRVPLLSFFYFACSKLKLVKSKGYFFRELLLFSVCKISLQEQARLVKTNGVTVSTKTQIDVLSVRHKHSSWNTLLCAFAKAMAKALCPKTQFVKMVSLCPCGKKIIQVFQV